MGKLSLKQGLKQPPYRYLFIYMITVRTCPRGRSSISTGWPWQQATARPLSCALRRKRAIAAIASPVPADVQPLSKPEAANGGHAPATNSSAGPTHSSSGSVTPPPEPTAADIAAVRKMLRANAAAADNHIFPSEEDIIIRELEITGLFLHNSGVALPDALRGGSIRALADHVLLLTNVVAAGSPFRTLQMVKRHPGLLVVAPQELGARVLLLKLLLPACNVSDLIYQKPTLLLMDDLTEQVCTCVHMVADQVPA